MSDGTKQFSRELLQIPGNDTCCDCGSPLPHWASYNLGILICDECAGIHRSLGTHISKVKSLILDKWDTIQQHHMRDTGNTKSKKIYEHKLPFYYCKPHHHDAFAFREQWICAKYVRKEFTKESTFTPLSPTSWREGYLFKRGKDDKKFNKRKFVLNHSDGTLKYFIHDSKAYPKASLQVTNLNLCMVPKKIGNANGMQISIDDKGHTRNMFVYAERSQDLMEWFMAIRAAKFHRLCLAYPFQNPDEFLDQLTHNFTKEGWLSKTGPRPTDCYRKRWFTLDKRKLMYYDDPMDAYPKGEIYIGARENGFVVRDGVPPGVKDLPYSFMLKTSDRNFNLAAETLDDKNDWIQTLKHIISEPMSPQENTNLYRAATVRKKRTSFMTFLGKS